MSVIGTGIAAGVANTTQSAKQQVQQRAGADAQSANNANNSDKVKLSQLHGAAATRDADQDMPDQQAPGYEDLYGEGDGEQSQDETATETPAPGDAIDLIHRSDAPACSPTGLPLGPTYGPRPHDGRAPLFSQLDVKA